MRLGVTKGHINDDLGELAIDDLKEFTIDELPVRDNSRSNTSTLIIERVE